MALYREDVACICICFPGFTLLYRSIESGRRKAHHAFYQTSTGEECQLTFDDGLSAWIITKKQLFTPKQSLYLFSIHTILWYNLVLTLASLKRAVCAGILHGGP